MITRGEDWGIRTTRSSDDEAVTGDIALAKCSPSQRLIVLSGDIAQSLGNPPAPSVGSECTEVSIDALQVVVTRRSGVSESIIASSSVIIGSWFRGRLLYVTNGGTVGVRNVAPRAHPNDGFFDVMALDPSMGFHQRLLARDRSRLGNHVPHPLINNNRARSIEFDRVNRTEKLRIDGRKIESWANVQINIIADYWRLLV
jgi:hypothetical protein